MNLNSVRFLPLAILISSLLFSCKKEKTLPGPSGLIISNITDSGCSIKWSAASGATGYKITIATDPSFNVPASGYNGLDVTNSYEDVTGLTPYTKYYVKLVAYNGQIYSASLTGEFVTADADRLVIVPWGNDDLYAFDARTGNLEWTFRGAPIVATPVIQDNVVYVGSTNSRVYALNLTNGTEKWKSEASTNAAGFYANALIKNGVVYIGDYRGRCHAYNASDGSSKWTYNIPSVYNNINSTPILNGNTIYFASYDGKIYALDAGTGAYKWSTASTGNPITSGIALVNDIIYVGASPKVYAFDGITGATKWVTPAPRFTSFSSSPTIANDKVFIGGEDGIMYAFNGADGSIFWSKTLSTGSIVSSPIYKNGNIYVGGGDGKMYALQSSTGNIVWQNMISTKNIYSGPTLSERALYTGSLEGVLTSMDIITGATKWVSHTDGGGLSASPCVITYKGDVYYPGLSGDIQ